MKHVASGFLDDLEVIPQTDGRTWVTMSRFRWHNGRAYEVPRWFVTDFASIPRLLWWIPGFAPTGRHMWAAVVHDKLYYSHEVSRREADAVFLAAMRDAGTLLVVRWAMWAAVRLFGWFAWRSDRLHGPGRVLEDRPRRWHKLPPRGIEWLLLKAMGRAKEV